MTNTATRKESQAGLCLLAIFLCTAGVAMEQIEQEKRRPEATTENPRERPGTPEKTFTRNERALAPIIPTCTTENIADLVPLGLVRAAVRIRADARWAKYAIGDPIPCADDTGAVVCYHVPVAIATTSFPQVLSAPPAAEVSAADLCKARLWGVGEFWTFVVSARESDYPICHHYQGLPPILVTYHKALALADQLLSGRRSSTRLIHYVSRGHAGTYYIFAGPNDMQICLDAYTLKERPRHLPTGVRSGRAEAATDTELAARRSAYRKEAQEAWTAIRGCAEEGRKK